MPSFQAGGLASGLDSSAIIDSLTSLEGQGLRTLRARQRGLQTQVSVIGDLASKLSALKSAAEALSSSGALGVKTTSTHSAFSATPASGSTAGRYSVQVTALAQAAKARSQGFASDSTPVTGSDLTLSVNGTNYAISVADGSTLADVAYSINQSGAPVSATVLNNGSQYYLSVTSKEVGYEVGQSPSSALSITESTTGSQGQPLALGMTQNASNAMVTVDGLTFERQSNEMTDVIPDVTLSLTQTMTSPQDLVLKNDTEATQANLQKFVDAYNDVAKVLQKQLNITSDTNRDTTLAGDSTLRSLQSRIQRIISSEVSGLGSVRTLADIGIKTGRDGLLSIDSSTLNTAIARDPNALNSLFSQNTSGISDLSGDLVDDYVDSIDGLLTTRKSTLQTRISSMDDDAANYELRLEKFRQTLVERFTAMEKIVAGLKSIGSFLSQQDAQASKG